MRIGDLGFGISPDLSNSNSEIWCVVGQGNEITGYVPDAEAFLRGGTKGCCAGAAGLLRWGEGSVGGLRGKLIGERAWWGTKDEV